MAGHRRATARLLALREEREDRPMLDPRPESPASSYDGRPRPAPGGDARLARLASFNAPEDGGPDDADPGARPGSVPPDVRAAGKA